MGFKKFKPYTPSRRYIIGPSFDELTEDSPEKSLLRPLTKKGGRNNTGRITMRRRGGGHKRRYRLIDFKRNKYGVPARVASIEYDPNRSARIALLFYHDGEKRYIIAPNGLSKGDTVVAGMKNVPVNPGNSMPLSEIPLGMSVHNIEIKPGKGGQIARAAGQAATLIAKEGNHALLKLPSTEVRRIPLNCFATIGHVGNTDHDRICLGKAGKSRWQGRRPKVRGVAMNPVDHPMGGGEGRSSGGRHPCTPWGKPTKGYRTRKKNKDSDRYIVRRRTS